MMGKKKGSWVSSVKCYNCGKTGKVPSQKDPTKEEKCIICDGTGYISERGILTS